MRISDWSSDVCSSDLKPIEKIFSHCFKLSGRNKAFELGLSISAIEYCRQHSSEVRENHLSAIRRKALHKHELHIPQAAELTKYLEFDILKRGHLRMPTNPVCHKRRPRTPRAAYKNNVCFHALSLRRLATEDAAFCDHDTEYPPALDLIKQGWIHV